jgi:hypothetical protein
VTSTEHWLTARTGLVPTARPKDRLSDTEIWNEGTRPSAPEPDATVQFTRRGLAAGKHLVDVHDHYRAELAQVRDILTQVRTAALDIGAARAELNALSLRANDWTLGSFCQSYCVALAQHHGLESDGMFPYLRARDPQLGAVLDRLDDEHHVIADLLEAVDRALVDLVRTPSDHTGIQAAVDLLTDALLSHLSYEEQELLAPLSRFGMYPGQV